MRQFFHIFVISVSCCNPSSPGNERVQNFRVQPSGLKLRTHVAVRSKGVGFVGTYMGSGGVFLVKFIYSANRQISSLGGLKLALTCILSRSSKWEKEF